MAGKRKRTRRTDARATQNRLLKEHKRDVRAIHQRLQESPAYEVAVDAALDDGVRAAITTGRGAQFGRLLAAGFFQNQPAADGAGTWDHPRRRFRIIHSVAREADGEIWGHVSVSHQDNSLPSWLDLRDACWTLYPDRLGLVVIAPRDEHVSVAEVLHAWVCLSAAPAVPDFRKLGVI